MLTIKKKTILQLLGSAKSFVLHRLKTTQPPWVGMNHDSELLTISVGVDRLVHNFYNSSQEDKDPS